jgi:hypothetical protein
MTLLEFVNLIVMILLGGFLTFAATQLVKQKVWPSWLKLLLSWVMAAVFALASAWKAGDVLGFATAWNSMSADAFLTYFVTYWAVATAWYKLVFKDTDWAIHLGEFPKT